MKTVGIIGGLGPLTTSRFYLEVMSACERLNYVDRPHILISSIPISYSSEIIEITKGIYDNKMLDLLLTAAKELVNGGAEFIVLPCNSAHTFFDEIKNHINVPMLNMIDETINYLIDNNISQVGLISTLVTQKNKLYSNLLAKKGIDVLLPDTTEQKNLNNIVLNLTSGLKLENDKFTLFKTIDRMYQHGVKHVVLACAALEILSPYHAGVVIHDSLKIFVRSTVKEILTNSSSAIDKASGDFNYEN